MSADKVALIIIVWMPLGIDLEMLCRSSSYPYDSTRSASSIARVRRLSSDKVEALIWRAARAGVATIISGELAKRERCTFWGIFRVRSTVRMSL